jgi:hypothetical protein
MNAILKKTEVLVPKFKQNQIMALNRQFRKPKSFLKAFEITGTDGSLILKIFRAVTHDSEVILKPEPVALL